MFASQVSLFLESADQAVKVADHDHTWPMILHHSHNKLAKQIIIKIKVSLLLKKVTDHLVGGRRLFTPMSRSNCIPLLQYYNVCLLYVYVRSCC